MILQKDVLKDEIRRGEWIEEDFYEPGTIKYVPNRCSQEVMPHTLGVLGPPK